ncbi:MAG TPA: CotH kinase family protein [Methylomirabilota bacterium]|nr:CotH kinase family protein [Methylomirabilota bacterium]
MLRDQLGAVLLVLLASLTASTQAADTFTSVYISEFVADNRRGLTDDDGDRPGWIELHNGSSSAVNLGGWFLTDTPTNLTKWRFPSLGLLPDKFIVVFASGKDRTNDLTSLHTNFRLTSQGGYLALVNRATNVVSEFSPTYPKQVASVSFGSVRGEPAVRGSFVRPTPGKPNMSRGVGFAPEVVFSKPGGNFTDPFTIQLSSAANGSVIRYTLDGTLPTTNSLVYAEPLTITNTTHLRARVYQDGLLPGPPHSEAYLHLSSNVLGFTSTLPVLIMDTFGKSWPVTPNDFFVHSSLHEQVGGKTSLTNAPTLTTRAGFHIRGSTSSGFPQSGFAVQFVDEFNDDQAHSLLGLPADSEWVLYAPNAYDPVMIHNPFIHQLSRDMGRYSPRTRFIEVYLVRNAGPVKESHYHGVYVLEEKISIGKQRVNIDRIGANDLKPPQVTGGYMMKFDRVGPGEGGFWGSGERGLVYVDPKEQTINLPQRTPQREYLHTFMRDFTRALHGSKWKNPAAGYRAYLDVDAAIDFHVLEVLSGNVDAMVLSTYFHKPRNGKITFGPHWDFDRALGSTDERDANPRHWNTGQFFGGEWWPRLFSDPDFWQQWVDRWQELRRTHFSLSHLNGLIDRLANEVREAQPREYARWGLQPRGGSYQTEIDLMKDWLSNRIDFIDEQLTQPPRLKREQGERVSQNFRLTLAAHTNATIYYTLDGSDPRLSQGAVSSNALVFTNPVPLKTSARVVARARDANRRQTDGPRSSTPWSAPVKADYTVAP